MPCVLSGQVERFDTTFNRGTTVEGGIAVEVFCSGTCCWGTAAAARVRVATVLLHPACYRGCVVRDVFKVLMRRIVRLTWLTFPYLSCPLTRQGLPPQWHALLQVSGITKNEIARNPQAMVDVLGFYTEDVQVRL